jgi:hypothetical protein
MDCNRNIRNEDTGFGFHLLPVRMPENNQHIDWYPGVFLFHPGNRIGVWIA